MSARRSRIPWVLIVALVWLLVSGNNLSEPAPTLAAGAGQIYVTEDTQILRVDDMKGTGRTTLGRAGTKVNQFNGPAGLFVDGTNRIYVADYGNNRIVRMADMAGAGWTTLGSLGGGVKQFRNPPGMFIDGVGRIYVADQGNGRIVRMNDMTGAGWTTLGNTGAQRFMVPVGIYMDGAGRICVADFAGLCE